MYRLLLDQNGNTSGNMVKRSSDGAFIPFDSNNRDYKAYLEWIAQGNSPTSE